MKEGGEEAIKLAQTQMTEQLQSVSEMIGYEISDNQELGPKPLSALDRLMELDIENRKAAEVIPLLDELFNMENSDFRWSDYFDDTTHNQIARCYSLMTGRVITPMISRKLKEEATALERQTMTSCMYEMLRVVHT